MNKNIFDKVENIQSDINDYFQSAEHIRELTTFDNWFIHSGFGIDRLAKTKKDYCVEINGKPYVFPIENRVYIENQYSIKEFNDANIGQDVYEMMDKIIKTLSRKIPKIFDLKYLIPICYNDYPLPITSVAYNNYQYCVVFDPVSAMPMDLAILDDDGIIKIHLQATINWISKQDVYCLNSSLSF